MPAPEQCPGLGQGLGWEQGQGQPRGEAETGHGAKGAGTGPRRAQHRAPWKGESSWWDCPAPMPATGTGKIALELILQIGLELILQTIFLRL